MWKGETVFIIGGGPSLLDLDLRPIHNRRVLGCNNAYELGSWVDVIYFGDSRWWNWNRKKIADLKYPGLIVTSAQDRRFEAHSRVKQLRRENRFGIVQHPRRVRWNKNTGSSAINLAVHFGAKIIVLVAFDIKQDLQKGLNRGNNWHANHETTTRDYIYGKNFLPHFPAIKRDLDALGIRCVNANPDSAIEVFEKMSFEEATKL